MQLGCTYIHIILSEGLIKQERILSESKTKFYENLKWFTSVDDTHVRKKKCSEVKQRSARSKAITTSRILRNNLQVLSKE